MYADWDGVLICVPFLFTLLSVWLLCPNMKYIASHASHLYPDTREGKNTHCPFFPQFSQFGGFASFFFAGFFLAIFIPCAFFHFLFPLVQKKTSLYFKSCNQHSRNSVTLTSSHL